jgi:DNA polymerase V
VDETGLQEDLFEPFGSEKTSSAKSERLMALMDEVNRKSRSTLCMARQVGPAAHAMRRVRIPAHHEHPFRTKVNTFR